jgi:hypothetical protein
VGHPALFAIWERRLRRQLEALLERERARPPAPGCLPVRFESRFGPLPVTFPDGAPIFLQGSIDRIDLGTGRAVVLDYKTGGRRSYAAHVKPEALCVTAWQLPIYAAAVRAELGAAVAVEARFYALRDAELTDAVDDPDLIALDDLGRARARARGVPNVADALGEVHRAMRAGDLAVRPREDACERCRMEAACRVMREAPVEEPE